MTPAALTLVTAKTTLTAKTTSLIDPTVTASNSEASLGNDFGAMLSGKLNLVAALRSAKPAAGNAAGNVRTLDDKIAQLVRAGKSDTEIMSTLAAQLADVIAHALGIPGADARTHLQAVFATALAPPGRLGSLQQSGAGRARMLAQRFRAVEKLATHVIDERKPGQQKRIAGTLLDAESAKEAPAPVNTLNSNSAASGGLAASSTTGDGRTVTLGTTAAVAGNGQQHGTAEPVARSIDVAKPVANGPPKAPSTPAPDARRVKLGEVRAIASNGDTLLGRVLTRAVLAADARERPSAGRSASDTRADTPVTAVRSAITAPADPRLAVPVQTATVAHRAPAPVGAGAAPTALRLVLAAQEVHAALLARTPPSLSATSAESQPPQKTTAATQSIPSPTVSAAAGVAAPEATRAAPDPGAASPASLLLAPLVAAPADGASSDLGDTTVVATVIDAGVNRGSKDVQSSTAEGQASTTSASAPTAHVPQAGVAAFIKSFESALRAPESEPRGQLPVVALGLPADLTTGAATATFVPTNAPFTIERTTAAEPLPSPSGPLIDHSAIVDQVLRGAFMRNVGASSEMRLSLAPQTLGDVNIKLVVTAGTVSAHVVAQTPEVRDALVAAQPQLTKSLADAGLKLTNLTVDLSGSGFAGFSQQRDTSQNRSNPGRLNGISDEDTTDDGDADATLAAVPWFGPAFSATADGRAYNYLA